MNIEITWPEVEDLIQRRPNMTDLLAALRSSPAEVGEEAPVWLQESWSNARESGLDSMDDDG